MGIKEKGHHDDFSKNEEYKRLIDDLKEIIEDAGAEGVDFSERFDVLECRGCGAYEDFLEGQWAVYDRDGEQTEQERFIVILVISVTKKK